MRDNEDATTSLGHSETLRIENSVGEPIPEVSQRPEEGSKRPSSFRRQDAGNVFPDDPAWPKTIGQRTELEGEPTTVVIQPAPASGDAETLTWGSSDENIDGCVIAAIDRGEVVVEWSRRETIREDGPRERVDFAEEGGLESEMIPGSAG